MFDDLEKWMKNIPTILHGHEPNDLDEGKTKRIEGISSSHTPVYPFNMENFLQELKKYENEKNSYPRKIFDKKNTLLKAVSLPFSFEDTVTYRYPLIRECKLEQIIKIILIDCSNSMNHLLNSNKLPVNLNSSKHLTFFLYHRDSIFSWSKQLNLPTIEGSTSISNCLRQLHDLMKDDTIHWFFSIEHISDGRISTDEYRSILNYLYEYAKKGHDYTLYEVRKQGSLTSSLGEAILNQFPTSVNISAKTVMI
ncbi:hypothetical protein ACFFJI_08840 [Allobacillus sp. GCM10007491]|uniref:Uncharacterized protein n=1 Tax=Allobacillus saliphilus TaxID=2912308 RepID=A0A941HT89_9BACI|nr:hypothetical protein [Allobacillus saliphilus]MBR7553044.1 hypothetical protein [Allobacillus saliphilus]